MFKIHRFRSLSSTNDILREMADAAEFTCVVAEAQTAGRGRNRRSWHSAPGEGLYLSLLLTPRPAAGIPLISLMAAVSVAEALAGFGLGGIDIKWPNDVLVNGRKISGILVEGASQGSSAARLILGIGVNLNQRSFPGELAATATSILIESGRETPVDAFLELLLERIRQWYDRWNEDPAEIARRWEGLSSYARGRRVAVSLDGGGIEGVTGGLTPEGALRVIDAAGAPHIVIAGEVRSLRAGSQPR